MRFAVIGGGVSGLVAARLLSLQHEVVLFEARDRLGGHAETVEATLHGRKFAIDTGFMVFNGRTYPHFLKLLAALGVAGQPSDMSFGVRCLASGLEYQGSSLRGLFAQKRNALRPKFLKMLADIAQFNRGLRTLVDSTDDDLSLREFLKRQGLRGWVVDKYLVPMGAAIWSSPTSEFLDFPAVFLAKFFQNHGLIQLRDRPQWQTVAGRSREYVTRLAKPLLPAARLATPVRSVVRRAEEVIVTTDEGEESFDRVVFACHADQTLGMLEDATPDEQRLLASFPYQQNEAVLHTDTTLLPKRPAAWASWNYLLPDGGQQSASVSYDVNRLQMLGHSEPILVTLNPPVPIDEGCVLQRLSYAHPQYRPGALSAQAALRTIDGERRTHFCGAYWGYGFHEDGVKSGWQVAKQYGLDWKDLTASMATPQQPAATPAP